MKLRFVLSVLVVFCLLSLRPALAREWTDDTGKHTMEAELLRVEDDTVHFKKNDGTTVKVPLNKLSKADRDFALVRAIDDWTVAIRLKPDSAEAYYFRGRAYACKGEDKAKSLADYNEAIRLKPDYADAYYFRALSYGDADRDKQIADLTAALRLKLNAERACWAYCSRGSAFERKGDRAAALDDYTAAIRLDHKRSDAYVDRASLYLNRGEPDKAIDDFTVALRLALRESDPIHRLFTASLAYHGRGMACAGKGLLEQAIADFSEAIRLDGGIRTSI